MTSLRADALRLKAQDVVDVPRFSFEAALTDQARTRSERRTEARFELLSLRKLIGQI